VNAATEHRKLAAIMFTDMVGDGPLVRRSIHSELAASVGRGSGAGVRLHRVLCAWHGSKRRSGKAA
jgi:hypothetical protein